MHLSGAALGFVLATVMLKKNMVDCEDWDLYAVMQGRQGQSKAAARIPRGPRPRKTALPENHAPRVSRGDPAVPKSIGDRAAAAQLRLRTHLDAGEAEAAESVYDKSVKTIPGWQPAGPDWLDLIKALNAARNWPASVKVMEDYLRRASNPSPRVRLKLAQILIHEQQRPAHALRVLGEIDASALPQSLDTLRQELTGKAEKMREEGVLELEGEAW